MLLIAISQILFWILIGLLFLTVAFSIKGTLSPIFTLLLLLVLGGGAFLCFFLSVPNIQTQSPTPPRTVLEDRSEVDDIRQDKLPKSKTQNPIGKTSKPKPPKNKVDEHENEVIEDEASPVIKNSIPQEYEVTDAKLRTYKTKGSLGLGKPFMTYFEEKTGWRKSKKGNYEIEVSHLGKFKQENGERERIYIYSGGEIEIKVNGELCCCNTIFTIPEGLSDSRLAKAREKLKQSISDLMFEHKESVASKLQKCL